MSRQTLTSTDGPIIVSEKTMRALLSLRREKLLTLLYGSLGVGMAQSNMDALSDVMSSKPDWLYVFRDQPEVELPQRCQTATASEAATLRVALAIPASMVLLEEPIKERAKLSFIKAEGTLSVLVEAYRLGHLSAVQPMVKALQSLGHADVLPDAAKLDALWKALDTLR